MRNWGECHKKSPSNAKTIASKIPIFITKLPVCIDNASKDQLTNTDTQEGVQSWRLKDIYRLMQIFVKLFFWISNILQFVIVYNII